MILTSIEKVAKDIGYDIGHSNDQVQADLLNGFCEAISNSMNPHDQGTQICYIVDKLSFKTHSILKEMVKFIELKETDKE